MFAPDAITTWADGFGMWHAFIPAGLALPTSPRRAAASAITEQLAARDEIGKGYNVDVELVDRADNGLHYREV